VLVALFRTGCINASAVGISTDITESRQAADQIRALNTAGAR
jgi:hypothetical protein